MDSPTFKIRIPNLTELDRLELSKKLEAKSVTFESTGLPADAHGELHPLSSVLRAIRGGSESKRCIYKRATTVNQTHHIAST